MKEILMYSSQFCPYCVNAEKLLHNKGIKKIKKIMVDENPSYMDEMIKIIKSAPTPPDAKKELKKLEKVVVVNIL